MLQALADRWSDLAIVPSQALFTQLAQKGLAGVAFGHLENGQVVALLLDGIVAQIGHHGRVLDGLGILWQGCHHLIVRAQVVILARHAHPVRIVERGLGLDGQQQVLSGGVLLARIVDVVGGDALEAEFARHGGQLLVDLEQLWDAVMLLQLNVKAICPEKIPVKAHRLAGAVDIAL